MTAPDALVDGKYRLGRVLGEGGMGTVYVAEHTFLRRQVAIKLLRRELAEQPGMAARFQVEAQAASRLDHPNLVRVTDFGRTPDGQLYLVMELLEGRPLSQETRGRVVERGRALWLAGEIARGLEAAHAAGVVHRDLKPENVLVCPDGEGRERVKIVDFGLAKLQGPPATTRLTHTGAVMGTPEYMAPEQARGEPDLDARVDVHALGVMLYELLAGQVPYPGENYNVVIFAILKGEPQPIARVVPGLDPALASLVMRAMAPRREERFASGRELGEALRALSTQAQPAPYRIPPSLELQPIGSAEERAASPTRPAIVHAPTLAAAPPGPELAPLAVAPSRPSRPELAPLSGAPPPRAEVAADRLLELPMPADLQTVPLSDPPPRALQPPEPSPRPRRSGRGLALGLGLALAGGLGFAGWRFYGAQGPGHPSEVRIWIDGRPPGASLSLDGAPVTTNPFSVPYSESIHELRVELRGRPARVFAFKPDEEQHIDLSPVRR